MLALTTGQCLSGAPGANFGVGHPVTSISSHGKTLPPPGDAP